MMENFQEKELQRVKNLNNNDNNICPDWVVEVTKILIEYDLYPYFDQAAKTINVLDVPEVFREKIFLEAKERNLWFEIKHYGKMLYKGFFRGMREPVGAIEGKVEFLIYENNTDKEIDRIFESVEIR